MPTYYDILSALLDVSPVVREITVKGVTYSIQDLWNQNNKQRKTEDDPLLLVVPLWKEIRSSINEISANTERQLNAIKEALQQIKSNINSYDTDTLIIALITVKFQISVLTPPNSRSDDKSFLLNDCVNLRRRGVINEIKENIEIRKDRWALTSMLTGDIINKEYRLSRDMGHPATRQGGRVAACATKSTRTRTRRRDTSRKTAKTSKAAKTSRSRSRSAKRRPAALKK